MIKLNKKAVLFAAMIFSAASVFAADFGGVISNNSVFKTNADQEFKLDQYNKAVLWARSPVVKNETTDSYVAAQATYSFERDFDKSENLQYVDLDLLKFVYRKLLSSSELAVSAGRFSTYDLSGTVFAQKADGIDVSFKNENVEVQLYGAYTGLLNARSDTMLTYDLNKISGDTEKLYDLAEKNAVAIACLKLPSVFAGQTVAVQGLCAAGFEEKSYNRFYGTAALSGPVTNLVYYNLSSTFGYTKYDQEEFELANLSKASVTAFPQFYNSSVSVNAVYASGNQGSFKPFRGITSNTAYDSPEECEYSGIVKAGAEFTVKPVSSVIVSGSADAVLSAVAGDNADQIEYKGFQFTAGADWQVVSDFNIGLKYSQYIDKENSDVNRKKIALKASLSF